MSQAAIALQPKLKAGRPVDYQRDAGRVALSKRMKVNKVVLVGDVFNTTGAPEVVWTHFAVLYTDPDGPGKKARVQAALKYVDQSGEPPRDVVKLDSNTQRYQTPHDATTTQQMRAAIKDHKLNFKRNYYFVEITVSRSKGSKLQPEVLGFKLCKQFE